MQSIQKLEEFIYYLRNNNVDLFEFGCLVAKNQLSDDHMRQYKKIIDVYKNISTDNIEIKGYYEIYTKEKVNRENLMHAKIMMDLVKISHYIEFKEKKSNSDYILSKFPSLKQYYFVKDDLFEIEPFIILPSALQYKDKVIYTKMKYPLVDYCMLYCRDNKDKINIKIALSPEIINISHYSKYVYFERIYGRPFSLENFKKIIVKEYGELKYYPKNKTEKFYAEVFNVPVDRLEYVFNPKIKENKISLSIAEIIDISKDKHRKLNEYLFHDYANSRKFIMIKILHTTYTRTIEKFDHLDCSLYFYNENNYNIRLSQHLKNKTIDADYKIKLFRVDGEIEFDDWSKFVALFFHKDPLIEEFLRGE